MSANTDQTILEDEDALPIEPRQGRWTFIAGQAWRTLEASGRRATLRLALWHAGHEVTVDTRVSVDDEQWRVVSTESRLIHLERVVA